MSVDGILGRHQLPVLPALLRPALRSGQGQGRGPRHACGPTTTGTSTSGAAPTPAGFIPLSHPGHLGPRAGGRRGPPGRREGLPRRHLLGEPREARPARASTPTTGTRSWRPAPTTGVVVCLHIGSSSQMHDHLGRGADPDVMISLHPGQLVQAVDRPDLLADPAQVPGRCTSPSPRAASAGFPTSSSASTTSTSTTTRGPARTSATSSPERGLQGADVDLLHRRRRSAFDLRDHMTSTTSPGSATTRTRTRPGRSRPRRCMEVARRRLRRGHRQDHAPQRHEHFQFDPFCVRPREKCTVGALRAEAADVDVEIKSMGRRKADADGASQAALRPSGRRSGQGLSVRPPHWTAPEHRPR